VLAAIGAVVAAAGGKRFHSTIASVLFIGGGIVFLWNAFAGGGPRGRRMEAFVYGTSHVAPADALAWVAVGVLVAAAGAIPAFVL
jgi:hypothetical protein